MSVRACTLVGASVLMLLSGPASAQDVTVKSLLADGFTVVGSSASNIGIGVLLQNKNKLYLCFVSETPKSVAVTTKYCKPVE